MKLFIIETSQGLHQTKSYLDHSRSGIEPSVQERTAIRSELLIPVLRGDYGVSLMETTDGGFHHHPTRFKSFLTPVKITDGRCPSKTVKGGIGSDSGLILVRELHERPFGLRSDFPPR
jgi:hypothetical protein